MRLSTENRRQTLSAACSAPGSMPNRTRPFPMMAVWGTITLLLLTAGYGILVTLLKMVGSLKIINFIGGSVR